MSHTVLVVDDDELLRRSLAFTLQSAGYRVKIVASAEEAIEIVGIETPDLILLDINLPGMDGLHAVSILRGYAPVIFLTARARPLDEVLGLERGADDYITKPFDVDVLLARIQARLRRSTASPQTAERLIVKGDLTIDAAGHTVTLRGQPIFLSPLEFRLLSFLARAADQVISVDLLLSQVWGPEYSGEPQVVYVCIRSLREKLEIDPGNPLRILTVRGVGYKFVSQEG